MSIFTPAPAPTWMASPVDPDTRTAKMLTLAIAATSMPPAVTSMPRTTAPFPRAHLDLCDVDIVRAPAPAGSTPPGSAAAP